MKKLTILICFMILMVLPDAGQDLKDPFDVMEKIDSNLQYKSAYAEMEMVITIKKRKISKSFRSYSVGNNKSFIEFLTPVRDKGTKILKDGKVIKIYYPSAERVMRLSGHMLRQSMMGSDMSYEDMTERSSSLREDYNAEMHPAETLDEIDCYVMTLTSKNKKQTYFKRKIWVDKKRYLGMKEELYSRSGKLVKVSKVVDVQLFGERFYPVEITMEDKLRKNSSTRVFIRKIDFNVDIPSSVFSERMLMK